MSGFAPLELQILSINVIGLASSTLNWFKWDRQLEKISNFSVSQSDGLEVKNVDWLKTILSWVVVARFVIDRVALLAYVANIYTIIRRSWQNLLVFWMVLSFLKDIVLEVIVIIVIFLLWYKGNVPTLLLIEFIAEKTVWLIVSICKWRTTLKWYMQLRRLAKIRKFAVIARRSIANIINIPDRFGRSLDDECLDVAIIRREKYASLLNLDKLGPFKNRVKFASLKSLVVDEPSRDSSDTNDYDSNGNDLSVAEKSMRMLRITAEDVMDARARIQERSYWNVQDEIATVEHEENMAGISKKYDMGKTHTLETESIMRYPLIERKKKRENDANVSIDTEEQTLIWKQIKNGDVALDKINDRVRSMESLDFYTTSESTEEADEIERIAQCCPLSIEIEGARYTDVYRKEHYKCSKVSSSSTCHRALHKRSSRKGLRSADVNDESIKRNVDREEFRRHMPIVDVDRRDNVNDAYRLRRQIQRCERPDERQVTWGSMSLAETAHPSGYDKRIVAADGSSICGKRIHIDARNDSNARYKLKQEAWNRQAFDLRPVYDIAPFNERHFGKPEEVTDAETLRTFNDNYLRSLESKRESKTKRRHNSLANLKLSVKKRESIELRALRAYNELTLLEDKRELETRRKGDSLLNYEQSAEEPETLETRALNPYNNLTLEDKRKMETATRGPDISESQSIDEPSALKVCDEIMLSEDAENLRAREKDDLSEDIRSPSSSDHPSGVNSEENTILSSVTRRDARSPFDLNVARYARQAQVSLNLREITRNIEWTAHPRGIILINKNLQTRFAESGRSDESQERDIVDDNVASMLHSAFFFKPEIVTRVFRRAQTSLVGGESLPSLPLYRREDVNAEFVCRLNNEMIVQDRDSSFDFNLERIMGDTSNLPDANDEPAVGEENARDLYIIFIDREWALAESETAIIDDTSTVESRNEDTQPSVERFRTTDILTLNGDRVRTDNATNDNLPVQFIIDILRDFGVDVSEGNMSAVTSSIEQTEDEHGDVTDAIASNDFQHRATSSAVDANSNDEINKGGNKISLHKSADTNEVVYEVAQAFNGNSNCSDSIDVTSPVTSLECNNPCGSRDERKLSANDIYPEKKEDEDNLSLTSADIEAISNYNDDGNNNRQFDTSINKIEENFNRIFENSLKLCLSDPLSFIESNNYCASILKSNIDEEQKLTQLPVDETSLENQREKSVLNLKSINYNTISPFQHVETFNSEITIRDTNARNEEEGRNTYVRENEFSDVNQFSKIDSYEKLRQYDSFYSTYEKIDNNVEAPISLENSLMEEFSDDVMPSEMPFDSSLGNSAFS